MPTLTAEEISELADIAQVAREYQRTRLLSKREEMERLLDCYFDPGRVRERKGRTSDTLTIFACFEFNAVDAPILRALKTTDKALAWRDENYYERFLVAFGVDHVPGQGNYPVSLAVHRSGTHTAIRRL